MIFGALLLPWPALAATNLDAGLENAKAGLVLCLRPDNERKRCNSLLRFRITDDGSVGVSADVTMSNVVVMHATYRAMIRAGAICNQTTTDEIEHATFTVGGFPASESETRTIRTQIVSNLRSRTPAEYCVSFEFQNGWFVRAAIGGIRRPEMDEPMIWLPSDHKYTASP